MGSTEQIDRAFFACHRLVSRNDIKDTTWEYQVFVSMMRKWESYIFVSIFLIYSRLHPLFGLTVTPPKLLLRNRLDAGATVVDGEL
jgi:hypothetical protein